MIIPVRCFSCGKPIAQYWEPYQERLAKGEDSKAILDSLGVEKYCCRSQFLGNVHMVKELGRFVK